MNIYYLLLATILVNGLFFGKKRKWFVFSSFFLLTLVAALRSTNIGIDLAGHYARYYQLIVQSDWTKILELKTYTGYDLGYIVFCKLIGLISPEPYCYIMATSVFVYFFVAVYVYRYSDDIVLETFLFITSFMYFMYMNIIAQSMAIAILMLAIRFLAEKKYWRYCVLALLATSIHSSAIFILLFIPLASLKIKRKYIYIYVCTMFVTIIGFDKILSLVVETFFPQFSHFLSEGNVHGEGQSLSLYTFCHLMIYVLSLVFAWIYIYSREKTVTEPMRIIRGRKNDTISVIQINSNFLVYMTISAVVFRVLATQVYVLSRIGYYTYFFGLSLLARSVNHAHGRKKILLKLFIYILFLLFFIMFGYSAGKLSYGVVPYEMFDY